MGGILGGGKGGSDEQAMPMYQQQGPDIGALSEMMGGYTEMMMGVMEQQASMMESMQQNFTDNQLNVMPQLPPVFEGPDIDWSEKNEQLKQQAAGTYNVDLARKKGMEDTVFSVLNDDDEEVATTSVLGS